MTEMTYPNGLTERDLPSQDNYRWWESEEVTQQLRTDGSFFQSGKR